MTLEKIGRNSPCPCGSQKKYKHCCLLKKIETAKVESETELKVPETLITQWFSTALQSHQSGHLSQAITLYRQIIQNHPRHSEALHLLGVALHQTGQVDQVLELITQAIQLKPSFYMYNNLGNILRDRKRYDEAISQYQQAIALNPDYAEAYNNLAVALQENNRRSDALGYFEKAIALNSQYAEAYGNLANLLKAQHKLPEAVVQYQKAIALKPNYADFYNNLGATLNSMKRFEEAMVQYQKAIALKPDFADAHCNLAHILKRLKKIAPAIFHYQQALLLKPGHEEALGALFYARQYCCDWTDYFEHKTQVIRAIQQGQDGYKPLSFLGVSASAQEQQQCAALFGQRHYPRLGTYPKGVLKKKSDKLRLAYVSGDFREHAVSILMVELFELHDRDRFEIMAISLQPSTTTSLGLRVVQAFDQFIDTTAKSDEEVAALIKDLDIDIAIDLMGFTAQSRTAIFSYQPAPIQVNYLGYPGTMGLEYMDYIIADPYCVPTQYQDYYTEKVVYLPDCYQVNDSKRLQPTQIPTRTDMGLKETGFVFCSFNGSYKVTPVFFEIWMRLLKAVPDSTLWLLADNDLVEEHLKAEALKRQVDPERLVFAKKVFYQEYLARYPVADLFLDTLPFNAGTTASDALWVGLPVLTCSGEAFASRMAGSLLHALDLPELVTDSLDAYEAMAVKLATQPDLLAALRAKLSRNRQSQSLFDTPRFCRHIEAAYLTMWKKHQRGEAPESFSVEPIS
jgi:predicted O-linked N-acetylglucosamine transferase (SPINDLY family)